MLQQMQHVQQEMLHLCVALQSYTYQGMQQMQHLQHVFFKLFIIRILRYFFKIFLQQSSDSEADVKSQRTGKGNIHSHGVAQHNILF